MRGEMNSNRYQISFRLKISLRWAAISLFVLTWIEVKWNSDQNGFLINNFDRNEISNWHKILCEHNLPEAKWISANALDIAFNAHVRLKLIAGVISLLLFWQTWNFISSDKITCRHYLKWNAYGCPSKYRVVLKCSRNETSREQNMFSRRFEI